MRTRYPAFFASLFLSRLADQVLLFLVPLVVFQTTRQAAWSGIAFFIEALPRYLVFPVCGALCDRMSPVKVLRASQLYRALACIGGVAGYALAGGIGWLIALAACCSVLTSQGLVAREVLLPQSSRNPASNRCCPRRSSPTSWASWRVRCLPRCSSDGGSGEPLSPR